MRWDDGWKFVGMYDFTLCGIPRVMIVFFEILFGGGPLCTTVLFFGAG